jgi:sugar phosphate isomerase/epimerase
MSLAYRLGCGCVVNSIGHVPESEDDPRWTSLESVIADLGRHGARVGAFLAAETGTESGPQLASLLGHRDDGFVAVALNPGQLIVNRHPVEEAVAALKDRIQVVCAVDGVLDLAAGRGLTVPLGQGTADFPQLIGFLEDVQYRGPYVVGRPDSTVQELQQGIEYLKNL